MQNRSVRLAVDVGKWNALWSMNTPQAESTKDELAAKRNRHEIRNALVFQAVVRRS